MLCYKCGEQVAEDRRQCTGCGGTHLVKEGWIPIKEVGSPLLVVSPTKLNNGDYWNRFHFYENYLEGYSDFGKRVGIQFRSIVKMTHQKYLLKKGTQGSIKITYYTTFEPPYSSCLLTLSNIVDVDTIFEQISTILMAYRKFYPQNRIENKFGFLIEEK